MTTVAAPSWGEVALGEVVTLHYGKALPLDQRNPNGTIPVYGANGVKDTADHHYAEGPSLVIGRKGSAGQVTRVNGPFWPLDVTYFTSHDRSRLDFGFLQYSLANLKLPKLARGVKPGINRNEVYAQQIPLPPLEEQRRIVAVLDEAFEGLDRARAHAEANFQDVQELFAQWSANIFESLTSQRSTQSVCVKDLALPEKGSIRTGPFGSQLLHSEFVEEGIAVLGIDNAVANEFRWGKRRFITQEKYSQLKRYTVHPGDVIITIMGTNGRCAVIPDNIPAAISTKHLCCISLNSRNCLPEYLHRYFLLSPRSRHYLSAEASGSVMDGLNMGIIKDMPVELPSIDEQRQLIARVVEFEADMKDVQASYEAQTGNLEDLRQSLLQRAFAGALT